MDLVFGIALLSLEYEIRVRYFINSVYIFKTYFQMILALIKIS